MYNVTYLLYCPCYSGACGEHFVDRENAANVDIPVICQSLHQCFEISRPIPEQMPIH